MIENGNNPIVPPGIDGIEFQVKQMDQSSPASTLIRNSTDFYTFEKTIVVPYSDAADANYYPTFYVAGVQCFLIEAKLKHGVAGGANAAVTVAKVPSGTAKSLGQSMLASYFDLTAVADTVQSKTGTVTLAGIQLAPGDSMCLKPTGTLTNARDVSVTVLLGVLAKHLPTGPNV